MRSYYYKTLSAFSGLVKFAYRDRIRILAFHDVKDMEQFDDLIKFLKDNYNVISLEDFRNSLEGNKALPNNSVLITFDDGDHSVYTKGLPVLKKHECTACLFVITGLINTKKNFWFYQVREKEKSNGKSSQEVNEIVKKLKSISNKERLRAIEQYGEGYNRQLTAQELDALREHDIFIGNHSHSHPMFNKCSRQEIREELDHSKKFFTKLEEYEVFAYPNGNSDETSEKLLKEKGIEMAFLFDHKLCSKKINPLQISRIRVNSDMPLDEFKAKVSGLHSLLFHARNTPTFRKREFLRMTKN